jgi:hypothetical protein
VIERRFLSGWANFLQHYKTIVDEWSLIDASDSSFKVIDWKEKQ